MAAAILGFFASSWFGWSMEDPSVSKRRWLVAAAVISLLVAAGGGFLAWRNWNEGTVFDEGTSRLFGIVVGLEVLLSGLGAWFLSSRKKSELIPAWIALVVGVHFFPLGALLRYPMLYVLAAAMTIAAIGGVLYARSRSLPISAVTGVGAGSLLLGGAVFSLVTVI